MEPSCFEKEKDILFTRKGLENLRKGSRKSQIPRHNEIVDELVRKICKDLGIPFVR